MPTAKTTYKKTNIPWISEIPAHWEVKRLKNIVNYEKGKVPKNFSEDSTKLPYLTMDYLRGKDENVIYVADGEKNVYVEKDDILVLWDGANAGEIIKAKKGCLSSTMAVLKTNEKYFHKDFFYYFLKAKEGYFKDMANGTTIPHLDPDSFFNKPFAIPPKQEQTAIAAYLDRQVEKINHFIKKKRHYIALLEEQRQAIINQAVTQGINANATLKNSGIEGLGEIPSHWQVRRLKYFADVNFSSVDRHQYEEEIKVDVCHYPDAYKNEFITSQTAISSGTCNQSEFERFKLRKGQVIITKDSESADDIGVPTFIAENIENAVCGYHLAIIETFSNDLIGEFIFRYLQIDNVKSYFELNANGVTRFGLGKTSIQSLLIVLPPKQEQTSIVSYIKAKTEKIDCAIAKVQKEIELIQEYKEAMIAEAVLGKFIIEE